MSMINKIYILKNKCCGQTIIEVIVALMLITLFLSGITIVEITASKNIIYSQNKSIASRFARQQLERARVVRDMSGIESLQICQSECYINNKLTPMPIIPTGIFTQTLRIVTNAQASCPVSDVSITPPPSSYEAIAHISWDTNIITTPAPVVEMTSCITDWR